jgi:TetR/AcrR family transcriptional repressor of nem operon
MSPSATNPVGRPREFDEDQVLDAAMEIFWLQGYESTSMKDLLAATGLHKGSLYQAFGDKHSLFIRSLRRYMDRFLQEMAVEIETADSGLQALRSIMNVSIGKGCHGTEGNAGCMALNTLADKGTEDPDILAALQESYGKRMQMISGAVARAQAEGSLRTDWTPERIATMISVMSTGTVAAVRGPLDVETAHTLVDDFLDTIKLNRNLD